MDLLDWEAQQSDHFTRMAYAEDSSSSSLSFISIENLAEDIGNILESTIQKPRDCYTTPSLPNSLPPTYNFHPNPHPYPYPHYHHFVLPNHPKINYRL